MRSWRRAFCLTLPLTLFPVSFKYGSNSLLFPNRYAVKRASLWLRSAFWDCVRWAGSCCRFGAGAEARYTDLVLCA